MNALLRPRELRSAPPGESGRAASHPPAPDPAPDARTDAAPAPRPAPPAIDPALLDALAARVHAASGLAPTPDTLARALRQRMGRRGGDAAAYVANLTSTELQHLLELLVVPESWLFRDPDAFTVAVRAARAKLAASTAPLRLLVVPCAAGEEAYSLAIALVEAGLPATRWHLDAVDLSQIALARARTGCYGSNAFRGADLGFRERHFHVEGSGWCIDGELRNGIHFKRANLLALPLVPGGYDIVFCRNLLIYFDAASSAAAFARLRALLAPDGVLCVGYAEVPAFCQAGFAALPVTGAFALQHAGAPPPPWLAAPAPSRRADERAPDRREQPRRPFRQPAASATTPGSTGAGAAPAHARNAAPQPVLRARAPTPADAPTSSRAGDSMAARGSESASTRTGDRTAPKGAALAGTGTSDSAAPHGSTRAGTGASDSAATRESATASTRAGDSTAPGPGARTPGAAASASAPAPPGPASAPSHRTSTGDDPAALLASAHVHADRGDLATAADLCTRVLAIAPETAEAWYLLAMAATSTGDAAAAQADLRRCLYLQPDHYPCLCQLALLAEQDGDRAAAARLRRRAARVHARGDAS